MPASVTQLRPRSISRAKALDAYRRADLAAARRGLTGSPEVSARLLLARTLLRGSQPEAARSVLEELPASETHAHICERQLLSGVAFMRLGAFDPAMERLSEARVFALAAASTPMLAEVECYEGLLAYARGDIDLYERKAETVLELVRPPYEPLGNYDVPLGHSRTRAWEALTIVAAARGVAADEVDATRRALCEIDAEPIVDYWIFTNAIANLAVAARNFDCASDAAVVRDRYDSLVWTEATAPRRFTILDSLGWCAAMSGDHVSAFRFFRRAADAATNDEERVVAAVDRATLAYDLEQHIVAREELDYARELAECIDWEESPTDRRLALCWVAGALASLDAVQARSFLLRYARIENSMPVLSTSRVDPRTNALEDFAEARVARAEGKIDRAVSLYRACFETWTKSGYAPHASTVALELAELGAGEAYGLFARRAAVRRPSSWLARRVAALPSR